MVSSAGPERWIERIGNFLMFSAPVRQSGPRLIRGLIVLSASAAAQLRGTDDEDSPNDAGPLALADPLFDGCTVTLLGCFAEGADDPHGRKVKDPASGQDIPLKLRSLPYGTACDVCDGGLNQCDQPPNARGGNWPKAPVTAPACDPNQMDLQYCAKVCMEWFGRSTPGGPMAHDVVYAGAQYGQQCWCMPTMFPATGVDVKEAENTASQCDVKCKADQQHICGGGAGTQPVHTACCCSLQLELRSLFACLNVCFCCRIGCLLRHAGWHNTVIKIDCSAAWGWSFVGALLLCSVAYVLLGVYGTQHWQR